MRITVVATILLLLSLILQAQIDTIAPRNEHTLSWQSPALGTPRTLWVHLPSNYSPADSQRYPVIYLLDGQVHFNYVSAMVEYLSSYDVNRMPKAIVVGIVHPDRGADLNIKHALRADGKPDTAVLENTGAARFLKFMKTEVIPKIDQQYKTVPYRILVGHSLAGLFAFYAKQKIPDLFQATVLLSPAIGGIDTVLTARFATLLRQRPTSKEKFFVAIGHEDTRQVRALTKVLETSAPKTMQWDYRQYPDENHFSMTFKGIYDGLKFIYRNWFFDYYGDLPLTYQEVEQRFNHLSAEYGYPLFPPEEFINNIGYKQLRTGHTDEAIRLFRYNVEHFPHSYNAYDSMGEAYMIKGDTLNAIENYEKSLQLNPDNEDGRNNLMKLKKH
ncbi:alpha/beta hydrolase-fold protein [Chitinophaga qingshengii]|uniref:Tetratricopeptide repeat protein n=1 Tax=Chitinophaga qingshengii TaxID=1569794 RepID=A0ABR7TVP1_9BACT|nr:alpha/beta hydrolase-fold protein [Chitinophaga qingshengii]MBC9933054.1 tetratricopeptide repeat protein [Chitinophaga qingshengii]